MDDDQFTAVRAAGHHGDSSASEQARALEHALTHMLTPLRGESMPPFAGMPNLLPNGFLSAFGEMATKCSKNPPFGKGRFQ
jgi:hypothetical protein